MPESGPASVDFTNFDYMIEKQYMAQPPTNSDVDPADPSEDFAPGDPTSAEPTIAVRAPI